MLIKCDAKGLEWRVKVLLAQDEVAIKEIKDPTLDVHAVNQHTFGLPKTEVGRVTAKVFLYRMIFADAFGPKGYEGPAYAYANDPEFQNTSNSIGFWKEVVGRFFDKYTGIREHSVELIREACNTGRILSPSGREYNYIPYTRYDGEPDWPRTQILNHIVQGLSADLMLLIRKAIWEVWDFSPNQLLNNTVHDDVEADVINDPGTIFKCACLMEDSFNRLPKLAKRWYGMDLNVPFAGEVKYGMTLFEDDMIKFNRNTFEKDFEKIWTRK